ncbi:MAG: helix-turn-helix domain-containing protein [Actinomycetota bacterium]
MSTAAQPTVWSTCDQEEAAASLAPAYGRVQVVGEAADPFCMSVARLRSGPVGLRRSRVLGSPSRFRAEDPRVLKVARATAGSVLLEVGRDRIAVGADPVLFPQEPFTSTWEAAELDAVVLEAAAVQDFARDLLDDPGFRLHFTGHAPVPGAETDRWRTAMDRLRREVLWDAEAMGIPLIQEHAFRTAARAVLSCFPSTFSDTPAPQEGQSLPGVVRRARAFIDAHLDEALGVAEIAAAARVSPQGLVLAFRRHLDTTPAGYLRAARLDAAHRDLVAADPSDGTTVETVARRWGFADPARFAEAYRGQHGQGPDAALHR